ncbi:MAG: hypothetical protein MJA28_00605 [Gammaproteobacteria bacterium]|nr:hypothetical protein [Gammaproteobacteria bacterium]
MSAYDRTGIQAIIGQKLDGQFQKLLSDHERPIQQKLFALKQQCSKAEKLNPELEGQNEIPISRSEDLEYLYACASQDIADKAQAHSFTKKSLQAAQLRHGYVSTNEAPPVLQGVLALALTVFGEALINAAFFSNAHMVAGPTAALVTSFLISMTNVAACATAGFFIGRYRDYGKNALDSDDEYFRRKRNKARVQFIGFIAVMVFFHLTVGLVRTQESIDVVHHSLPAYLEMMKTPEAIFLILMGGCMSVFAFHKGIHSFDCPYPEIGRLQRAEEAAKEDIHDTVDFYKDEVNDHFDDCKKSLEEAVESKKKSVDKYNKAVSACHEAKRHLDESAKEAENQCRGKLAELITSYNCISGEDQDIPMDALYRMVSFEKYLDFEIPAFRACPEARAFHSELLIEKNQAVKRLSLIFNDVLNTTGGKKS